MNLDIKLYKDGESSAHRIECHARPERDSRHRMAQFIIDGQPFSPDSAVVAPGTYSILIDGQSFEATVARADQGAADASNTWVVNVGERHFQLEVVDPRARRYAGKVVAHDGPMDISAPMPGKIIKLLVSKDEEVRADQGLAVIEAMKMQNELRAPRPGRIAEVYVSEGVGIEAGAKLLRLE